MIYIVGLDLRNVVTFKNVSVDFNQNLTYIRGLNLDSDPAAPTSNGAGKTLLFSSLANILYQTTPHALKKRAKKDILRQKGSSIGLILRPSKDGPEYEIIQTSSGYRIYKDGENLKVRTIPLAEEFIRTVFPLSETKFYSTCYLSTQRPYPLQRDTDSNRLQHITDIFNLDQYDSIRTILAKRLRTLKDNEVKLAVLEQQLVGLRRRIKELNRPSSPSEYQAAKKQFEDLLSKIDEVQAERFKQTTRKRDLRALLDVERSLDSLREVYPFKKKPEVQLRILKEQRDHRLMWDRWYEMSTHAQATYDRLNAKIKQFEVPDVDVDDLSARCERLSDIIEANEGELIKAIRQKKLYEAAVAEINELEAQYAELGVEAEEHHDYESEIAVLKATLKLERLIHDHEDSSKCPTCNSPLNMESIKSAVAKAKKRLAKLEKLQTAAELRSRIAKLQQDLPEFDLDHLNSIKERLKKAKRKLAENNKTLEKISKYQELVRQRDAVEFPEKPKCRKVDMSVSDIESSIELCNSILNLLSQKEMLLSNHPDLSDLRSADAVESELSSVEDSLASLDKKLAELRDRQSACAGIVSEYEQYQNTFKVYDRERVGLEAEIAKLAPEVADKKILEILMKAYGPKGLRATAAESVCRLFQTNLNHYRDLIFAEPFTFEVKVSESGVSILVDRNNGKPDSVSDVRNLSGAESNSFQLLCLISLLPLLPDNDRVNLVVLDEPTAHMDAVSRSIFNERFLPVLREVVPSIYVISPHSDDTCPNSSEWVIRKQNGISTLIQ